MRSQLVLFLVCVAGLAGFLIGRVSSGDGVQPVDRAQPRFESDPGPDPDFRENEESRDPDGVVENATESPPEAQERVRILPPDPLRLETVSSGTGSVRVLVRREDGTPRAGVKVVMFAWSDESKLEGRHELQTDSSGWAAVDTIAARLWSVGAYVDSGRRSLVRIQVEPGRVTEVRLELPVGVEVCGEVRDVVRGLLPDLKIEFSRESDGFHDGFWGRTDSAGRYRLTGVMPGTYVVTLTGGPFGYASRRRYWIEVPAADEMVTRDLRVGVRSLIGKVVDEETLEPVPDARVRLEPLFRTKRPRNVSLVSSSKGQFGFVDLPAGAYRMHVFSDGYATHTIPTVDIEPGAEESVEVRLQPAATLNLVVVDQAGSPVEGEMSLSISRTGSSHGTGSRICTDSEGRATYRRATAGNYRISVFKDGFGRASVRTELRRGENTLRLAFPP